MHEQERASELQKGTSVSMVYINDHAIALLLERATNDQSANHRNNLLDIRVIYSSLRLTQIEATEALTR